MSYIKLKFNIPNSHIEVSVPISNNTNHTINRMADILDTYTFDIDTIGLSNKGLTKLPDLTRFTKLKTLICSYNSLKELNNLPNTLTTLHCHDNQLTKLSNLPNTLTELYCHDNKLTELTNLPNTLATLDCGNNQLIKLNNIPNSICALICYNNLLTELHNLPNRIYWFKCDYNQLLFTEIQELRKLDKFIKFFNLNKLLKVIFLYLVKKRCLKYKEELIIKTCHPSRLFFI